VNYELESLQKKAAVA